VIDPWSEQYAPGAGGIITQRFNPAIGEYGVDVALPVGTPIRAPYPGVVVGAEDQGKQNWGKRIFEEFTAGPYAGYTFGVGHLTAFGAQPGSAVPAGGLLGYSGGAVTDPSSGHSTGPHIEPQLIAPGGQYVDPFNWLRSIFATGGASAAPATTKKPAGANLPADYVPADIILPGGRHIPFPGTDFDFNNPLRGLPGQPGYDPGGGSALGDIPQALAAAILAPFTAAWNGFVYLLQALGTNTQVFFQRNVIAIGVALAVCLVLFVL
jgi:murein DD-endopeptidase MepM/ murein hydrolase activator NlpD